jgi:hypothetical protein
MNSDKLRVAEINAQGLSKGITSAGSLITNEFTLDETSVNVHVTEYAGIGPRYGMQPAPFHAVDSQDPTSIVPQFYTPSSLRFSEREAVSFLQKRTRIYGVFPFTLAQYEGENFIAKPKENNSSYFFITDMVFRNSNDLYEPRGLTIGYTCRMEFGSEENWIARHGPFFDTGIAADLTYYKSAVIFPPVLNTFRTVPNEKFRRFDQNETQKNFYKTASFSVSGVENKFNNIVGYRSKFSNKPDPGTWMLNGFSRQVNFGYIPSEVTGYTVIVLGQQASNNNMQWYKKFLRTSVALTTGSNPSFQALPDTAVGREYTNMAIDGGSGGFQDGANVGAITRNQIVLFQNSNFKISSAYTAFFVAKESPVAALYQEHLAQFGRRRTSTLIGASDANFATGMQYFNPCRHYLEVSNQGSFFDDGVTKQTGFTVFPEYDFPTNGKVLPDDSIPRDGGVSNYVLGNANTGLLRAFTTYELAFAIFDKGTNTEGNVCSPVKFRTSDQDFVKLSVYRQVTSGPASPEACNLNPDTNPLTPNVLGAGFRLLANTPDTNFIDYPLLNHLEIRFYYRPLGSFDWLPTSRFDYAEFYMDPTVKTRWICEAPIAALPGGQPGGIVDNSGLQQDKYIDVIVFQSYVFWLSAQRLSWSNKNDVFTYPVLNSVTISKGFCQGMLEHVYPGQSVQDSRLLLFTSNAIYAGRFTGNLDQVSVRVDPNTSATFNRPGSDFVMTFWTSNVAFSSRSAVVAKGVLYYWGPTGLFMDDGSNLPDKSWSMKIEPWVHTLYDKARSSEIVAVYNDKTKEVIWFFPPRKLGNQMALSYHTEAGAFFLFDLGKTIVDNAQILDVSLNKKDNTDLCSSRIALYVRDADNLNLPQQMVFFDELCDCGDTKPTNIAFCSGVAVNGLNRRLTISSLSSLPTTGSLTIKNYNGYSDVLNSAGIPDAIYSIVGGNGSSYVDIAPVGGSWVGTDFAIGSGGQVRNYFPVSWASSHGFTYRILSDYYMPGAWQDWFRFIHCHQAYRVDKLARSFAAQKVTLNFRTVLGTGLATRDVTLTDNSRGMCQVFSQIPFTQQNHESQAMSIELTGALFCGSRWKLQYLSYHMQQQTMGSLRTFEG